MSESTRKKVQISICSAAGVDHESFMSYHHMLMYLARHTPHEYTLCYAARSFIHMARKACVNRAIESKADYVLFLDDDMVWLPHMPAKLVTAAEQNNLDIISGFYTTRKEIPYPLIYNAVGNGKYSPVMPKPENYNKIIQCDATGFGAILLKTDVFKRIPEPWFEIPDNMTEDVYFFNKCKDAGIKVHVDASLPCGHKGDWGWNFPYKTEMENYVKGNIVRADEALFSSGQIDSGETNNGSDSDKEDESEGRGECESGTGCEREEGSGVSNIRLE